MLIELICMTLPILFMGPEAVFGLSVHLCVYDVCVAEAFSVWLTVTELKLPKYQFYYGEGLH